MSDLTERYPLKPSDRMYAKWCETLHCVSMSRFIVRPIGSDAMAEYVCGRHISRVIIVMQEEYKRAVVVQSS